MKDAISKEVSEGRMEPSNQGQEVWTKVDKSSESPRQTNGVDCKDFALTFICLLRNGMQLARKAYAQGTLTRRESRRRLAMSIWETGIGEELVRWQPRQRTATGMTKGLQRTGTTNAGVRGRKRKRNRERRIVPGSKRMMTLFELYEKIKANKGDNIRTPATYAQQSSRCVRRFLYTHYLCSRFCLLENIFI